MLYCLLLPPAFARLGGAVIFKTQGVMSAVYAVYVWLRLPETKGYEISEIESILHHTEWVPFEPAPPAATDAEEMREAASRVARTGGLELHTRGGAAASAGLSPVARAAAAAAAAAGPALTAGGGGGGEGDARVFSDWDEYDIWGGRGAYRT
jgi:hypothetical protein